MGARNLPGKRLPLQKRKNFLRLKPQLMIEIIFSRIVPIRDQTAPLDNFINKINKYNFTAFQNQIGITGFTESPI